MMKPHKCQKSTYNMFLRILKILIYNNFGYLFLIPPSSVEMLTVPQTVSIIFSLLSESTIKLLSYHKDVHFITVPLYLL